MNSTVKNFFVEYRKQSNIIKELKNYNNDLVNEIKCAQGNFNNLIEQEQQNISNGLNTESIYSLYISTKEKNEMLLKEIEKVKQEKEILVKHYEEKILFHKSELEKEKRNIDLKENEFNDKLVLYQASTALQNDELESKWIDRLNIVNQQLKDSNMSCNLLRSQLVDIKNRFTVANTEAEKRIQELEQSLMTAEEEIRKTQEKLFNNPIGVPTYMGTKNLYSRNRPFTYAIAKPHSTYHSVANTSVCSNSRSYGPLTVINEHELNKSNSSIKLDKTPTRGTKRKLYNLDDFE